MTGDRGQTSKAAASGSGPQTSAPGAATTNDVDRTARTAAGRSLDQRPSVQLSNLDTEPDWPDLSRPNAARVYDYFLDGALNYKIDREFAHEAMTIFPAIQEGARDNRGFLRRAVRYMASQGVRQFLDLGCGITTVGSSWEVAKRARLDARVVCVDNEPVAVHAMEEAIRRRPERNKHIEVIQADFTDPDAIFRNHLVSGILDTSQPIGVLMVAILHFLKPGNQPRDLIKRYMDWAARGSYVAVSVATADDAPPWQQAQLDQFAKKYENTSSPLYLHRRDEVRSWFDGLDLVSPSTDDKDGATPLVRLADWMPEPADPAPRQFSSAHYCAWCGVARKPASYPNT